MPKILVKMADVSILAIFQPFIGIKALQKYIYIVEEVLSFDLVGHL